MKKLFTFAAALLASLTMMAQSYTTLFSTDFSDASWAGHDTICKGATAEETINGIFFRSANNSKYYTIADGALTFCDNNSGNAYFMAIPVQNVNDSVIVTIGTVDNSQRVNYLFRETNVISTSSVSMTSTAASINTNKSITIKYAMKTDSTVALVMLGRQGSGQKTVIKSITVSTLSGGEPPVPSTDSVAAATISGADSCYVGKSVTLTCTAEHATTYQWYNTDGIIEGATAKTYVFTPAAEGIYGFYCMASNQYNTNPVRSNSLIVTATIKPAAVPCANIIPASSGTVPTEVGAEIDLDLMSDGGKLIVAGMKTPGESFVYSQYGLGFMKGGADSIRVEFNNYIAEGSVIKLVIVSNGTGDRGLKLQTLAKSVLLNASWNAAAAAEVKEFEYEVPAGSALIGTNKILLQRNNSVYLQSVSMADCGDPVPGTGTDYTPILNVNKSSVDLDVTAAVAEPTASVVYTGKHLVPGEYALTVPDLAGLTVNPVAVTVGADSLLNATINLSFTSDVEIAAASSSISLTIGDLTKSVTINYSATLAKAYMSSLNIEQFVLDNGKSGDIASALTAAHIDFANINDLDSLNDLENKANRNYAYLGLKLKTSGAFIAGWIHTGDTINVKFGAVGGDIKVRINGAEQTFAKADLENNVLGRRAATEEYLELITTSGSTVVLKQIIINENTAEVELPAPSAYLITCAEAEHGSVTVNWEDKKYRTPVGATVTVTPTPAEGYHVASVTAGDAVLVPVEGVYSFVMIAQDITVSATFAADEPVVPTLYAVTCDGDTENGAVGIEGGLLNFEAGVEITLTNIPEEGYELDEYIVYKTGEPTTLVTVTDGKFIMPAYDVTVSATFKLIPVVEMFTVTLGTYEHGNVAFIEPNEGNKYAKDAEVRLSVTPDEGYELESISLEGIELVIPVVDGVASFNMPAQNVTVLATFILSSGQGFDNIDASMKATKRIINGKLFIEKNGKLYDAQGAMVK